jgi:hypothetical protein
VLQRQPRLPRKPVDQAAVRPVTALTGDGHHGTMRTLGE